MQCIFKIFHNKTNLLFVVSALSVLSKTTIKLLEIDAVLRSSGATEKHFRKGVILGFEAKKVCRVNINAWSEISKPIQPLQI